jgi:hypothetical protein
VESDHQPSFSNHAAEGLALPPWEERQRYGFFNAVYLTIRNSLFSPGAFFSRMPTRIGLSQPLLFAMIIGVIGAFFQWMWSLTGSSLTGALLHLVLRKDVSDILEAPLKAGLIFAFSPVLIICNVFAATGIVHLSLMLVGGNRLGFEATFRVMAYAAATAIFLVVPICGIWVLLFWAVTIIVIGLQKIHDIREWRAIVAVLPLLLCLFYCGRLLINLLGLRVIAL